MRKFNSCISSRNLYKNNFTPHRFSCRKPFSDIKTLLKEIQDVQNVRGLREKAYGRQ